MKHIKLIFPLVITTLLLSSCNMGTVKVEGEIDSREINANMGLIDVPHTGNPKMLVIPVDFYDAPASTSLHNYQITSNIETAFFGSKNDNYWESVSSYYSKSSYGKLNIEVVVANSWYRAPQSTSYYTALATNSSVKAVTDNLAYEAVKWYHEENPDVDLSQFDTDKDGYIDAVWLVYSKSYNNNSDLWWAFTTWNNDEESKVDNLKVGGYSWASYEFLRYDSFTRKPDAHTFIHETGHLLGLDDYYDADSTGKNPTGGLTMMDCNIGDIDSFSKYLLGWIKPTVANSGQSVYSLKPFESSGDALIIPIDYSDNPYGEYLILEYYTPTGLNKQDALTAYKTNKKQMYTQSGLIMYHVDNRLGKLSYRPGLGTSWNKKYYTNITSYRSNLYIYIPVNSNTPSSSYAVDTTQKLIGLIGADDTSFRAAENRTTYADNSFLFQKGDTFNASKFQTNSLKDIPFGFEVSDKTDNEIIITLK